MNKKTIALLMALVLLLGCSIGGTIAWLTATSETVTNTFTASDINITLEETTGTSYKMVPGGTITKDPLVTVKKDSEACWLFVQLTKSDNYSTYLENYTMADGWEKVDGEDDVYYRQVAAATSDTEFSVLKDKALYVKTSVTKAQMEAIQNSGQPTLKIAAFAIQSENLAYPDDAATTAAQAAYAWSQITA